MTSTLISKDAKNIVMIDNLQMDLNEMFHLSYNFDMLKKVIIGLTQQFAETDKTFEEVNKKIDSKDKLVGNLEIKLVNSIRMLSEKIEDKAKDMEESVRSGNQDNLQKQNLILKKFEETINSLVTKIEKIENENQISKERIKTLEDTINNLENETVKNLESSLSNANNTISDLEIKDSGKEHKINKLEKQIIELTGKFAEINIFETLKNIKPGEGGSSDASILLIEGVKNNLTHKIDNLDKKVELIQDQTSKLNSDSIGFNRKLEVQKETQQEATKRIDFIVNQISEIKINLKNVNASTPVSSGVTPGNKLTSKKSISFIPNSDQNENFEQRISFLEEEIKKLNKFDDIKFDIKDDKKSLSTNAGVGIEDNQVKSKLVDLEKQFKVFLMKDKEKEEQSNKKFANFGDLLKLKTDKETFLNLNEEVEILKRKFEEFKNEYHNTVEKAHQDEILWCKKKIESINVNITELKNITKTGIKEKDNDPFSDQLVQGKFLEVNFFNEFRSKLEKEFAAIRLKIEEMKILIEEEIFSNLSKKANEKDLKILEGKTFI